MDIPQGLCGLEKRFVSLLRKIRAELTNHLARLFNSIIQILSVRNRDNKCRFPKHRANLEGNFYVYVAVFAGNQDGVEIELSVRHGASPSQTSNLALPACGVKYISADIFIVRDGTYLVGTSCILNENDTKILYCGGLYKLRVNKRNKINPYLLLTLLNTPIVRRQMRARQFTRDIIDTLGKRLFQVYIPVPKNAGLRKRITDKTRETILKRIDLRIQARDITAGIEALK